MGLFFSNFEISVDTTQHSVDELKRRLEGQTKRVRMSPEVYVTFDEVKMEDGGAIKFTSAKFTLDGLHFKTTIKVTGSPGDIPNLMMSKVRAICGTPRVTPRASADDGAGPRVVERPQPEIDHKKSKLCACMSPIAGAVGTVSEQAKKLLHVTHTFHAEMTVCMRRELGQDEVQVDIKNFVTDHLAMCQLMRVEHARAYVEHALSLKATEVATRMGKQQAEMLRRKVCCCK